MNYLLLIGAFVAGWSLLLLISGERIRCVMEIDARRREQELREAELAREAASHAPGKQRGAPIPVANVVEVTEA